MNLIKIGKTVVNLNHIISITATEDFKTVTVETTSRKVNYDANSDYGLLYMFLSGASSEVEYLKMGGIQVLNLKSVGNNSNDVNPAPASVVTSFEFGEGKILRFQ